LPQREDISAPREDIAAPGEDISAPGEDISAPGEDISAPTEAIAGPEKATVRESDEASPVVILLPLLLLLLMLAILISSVPTLSVLASSMRSSRKIAPSADAPSFCCTDGRGASEDILMAEDDVKVDTEARDEMSEEDEEDEEEEMLDAVSVANGVTNDSVENNCNGSDAIAGT
jgi:hypothetical protein